MKSIIYLAALFAAAGAWADASAAKVDWTTYGFNYARTANNAYEKTLGVTNVAGLKEKWATGIDGGAITAQAIVGVDIATPSGPRDLVFAGTQRGTIAAIDAATGQIVWTRSTGYTVAGCGDLPDGQFGISAAMTYSKAEKRLYTMGGDGALYALNPATGATVAGFPVRILPDAAREHVYGGLTSYDGAIYVAVASMCDQTNYHGRVVRIDTRTAHAVTNAFYADFATMRPGGHHISQPGSGGGGIWGPGGVSLDTTTKQLFAATGNLLDSASEHDGYGDQVVRLNLDLTVADAHYPGLANPNGDVDFGSTPVLYQFGAACPLSLAVINKSGLLFTYRRTEIALGPLQRLPNNSYTGDVAVDTTNQQLIVTNLDSVQAWRASGPSCALTLAWQTPASSGPYGELGQAVSPPTIANGVVYYVNGAGGTFYAIDAKTGAVLFSAAAGGNGFAAPTVVNAQVFVPAWDGKVHAFAQ